MTPQQLKTLHDRITGALDRRRFSEAIAQLKTMAEASAASWDIRSEADRVASTYAMLSDYALGGSPDPSRADMLARIDNDIRRICNLILRDKESELSNTLYFSTVRYERMQTDTIASLLDTYAARYSDMAMLVFAPQSGKAEQLQRELDSLALRIFNRVWVSCPLSKSDAEAIAARVADGSLPEYLVAQMVSALSLGCLQYFDARRVELLADIYERGTDRCALRALVGILLILWRWRSNPIDGKLKARLEHIAELPDWDKDVRLAFMQFIRARDTERVTRAMNDELIPRMMKLRDKLGKFAEMENPEELAALEENPEWEEMMRDSGIEDSLKKLNDMQEEGADVMMSTFSHLKSFNFFNDIANWFLPFHTDASALADIKGTGALDYLALVSASPMLCDSDRYSMALSLDRVPESQRNMLLSQLSGHAKAFEEMAESNVGDKKRETLISGYVKDLYRFYNLFRRKGEFYNPFAAPINLAEIDLLAPALSGGGILATVAQFYFAHGYFAEALNVYRRLIDDNPLDETLYQKAGYCKQKLGDVQGALEMYRRSELINPSSTWTIRRIAYCSKMLGDADEALRYFNMLAEKFPDDLKVTMSIGHCRMELGEYDAALQCYHKVEYIKGEADATSRPIAWCSFLSGDYKKAASYYARLDKEKLTAADCLNMGHLDMAMKNYRRAADNYYAALQCMERDFDKLSEAVDADRKYLDAAGVDGLMTDIVLDAVDSRLWQS